MTDLYLLGALVVIALFMGIWHWIGRLIAGNGFILLAIVAWTQTNDTLVSILCVAIGLCIFATLTDTELYDRT